MLLAFLGQYVPDLLPHVVGLTLGVDAVVRAAARRGSSRDDGSAGAIAARPLKRPHTNPVPISLVMGVVVVPISHFERLGKSQV
jgi:hypothetical protein